MNYEKEYKKLKADISKAYLYAQTDSTKAVLETIFPELKENDSEKIRKELIDFVKSRLASFPECDRFIAWLGKQGEIDKESYKIDEKEKREFVGDGFIKCYADFQDFREGETYWLEYIGNDKYNVRSDNLLGKTYHITPCQLYTIFKKQTWLEKQGEQKSAKNIVESWKDMRLEVYQQASGNRHEPNYSDDTTKMFSLNDIDEIIEKMSEQKPANKVEPKFKVGDYVVGKYISGYISEVRDDCYLLDYQGFPIDKQDNYHLWSIEDAKDGDVLVRNNDMLSICIFSHFDGIYNKFSSFLCHCGLEGEGLGQELSINGYHDDSKNYLPATKEQRDTLLKAMADAGWEFDFEKKELKKIESNSAWSEEDKDFMYDTLTNLTELKDRYGEGYGNVGKCIDWLKSLKDRVQTLAKMEKGIK